MAKASVYIAGPMSGYKNFNFDSFFAAEKYLKSLGFDEIGNPARWDHETYGEKVNQSETGSLAEASENAGFDLRKTLNKDLSFLCTNATHIFMLKGWENSKGARAEHATANALGLDVIYQTSF
jgi:Domain of unknown function (DUF4406)